MIHYFIGRDYHWVFMVSHHGKGEHDGHGATVKNKMKLFVLPGNQSGV